MPDRVTPLLGPNHVTLRRALAFPANRYGERFVDVEFWRPFIDRICASTNLHPTDVTGGAPGTFPTFIINRSHVVKLFGQPFDGLRCWQVELDVASTVGSGIEGVPIPDVISAGVLSDVPAWRFIVSRFIEGTPFATARTSMTHGQRLALARRLGTMVRALHDLPIPDRPALRPGWDDWHTFISTQQRGMIERHRGWKVLPARLIAQIDAWVAPYNVVAGTHPSLLHADLHHDHVLVATPDGAPIQVHGVIDWGDARVGDRYYELPALHLGLFHGDTAMLAAFLASYGWEGFRTEAFVHRAMSMTLLHEFNVLENITFPEEPASLAALAESLWRV